MKFTFYGHSCFKVETQDGKHLLFDPFISPNEIAKHIKINDIKADYIFLSHGHDDHIADALTIAQNNNAKIISNYEIISWYATKFGYENGHPMNLGGQAAFDFGVVKYVNAVHSSQLPDGTYGGNPGGFIVNDGKDTFYYSGDTALTLDMKLIPIMGINLDFCVFSIGDNFTMGPADAVIASDFVECDTIVGVHYDTFGYIKIDKIVAQEGFAASGKKLILPAIGDTIEI
ncbi:UNVERIFIED_CONTAM: hypothetical protein GTU68_002064 [Idotea baltica]|nr:hypothetical protein [Idotea baltica]